MAASGLSLLTFNIGNPSEERARRQLGWLAARDEQVLVLTETKASSGCQFLADAFAAAGYDITFPVPEPGEYGVMIISRIQARPDAFGDLIGYLPARAAAITLPTPDGPVQIIGAYVPSRDAGPEKTERKQKWLAACSAALTARDAGVPAVFLGDLNLLEPDHQPHYPFFAPFEYGFYRELGTRHGFVDAFRYLHPDAVEHSWVGRTGDGYRYDHIFCSTASATSIADCGYVHQPREDRLSDHSALTARLAVRPSPALLVSDPVAAITPATLF